MLSYLSFIDYPFYHDQLVDCERHRIENEQTLATSMTVLPVQQSEALRIAHSHVRLALVEPSEETAILINSD